VRREGGTTHRWIPNRFQPSRFVVLSRSSRWKYPKGEVEDSAGLPVGIVSKTFSTVHGPSIVGFGTTPTSSRAVSRIHSRSGGGSQRVDIPDVGCSSVAKVLLFPEATVGALFARAPWALPPASATLGDIFGTRSVSGWLLVSDSVANEGQKGRVNSGVPKPVNT